MEIVTAKLQTANVHYFLKKSNYPNFCISGEFYRTWYWIWKKNELQLSPDHRTVFLFLCLIVLPVLLRLFLYTYEPITVCFQNGKF